VDSAIEAGIASISSKENIKLKPVQELLCGINRITVVTATPCPMSILFLNYKYVPVSSMHNHWARKGCEDLCFQAQLVNSATCCPDLFPNFEVL